MRRVAYNKEYSSQSVHCKQSFLVLFHAYFSFGWANSHESSTKGFKGSKGQRAFCKGIFVPLSP